MGRDPLTERYARELREIDPDPRDWSDGPHRPRAPWRRYQFTAWGAVLIALCLSAAAASVLVGAWWIFS